YILEAYSAKEFKFGIDYVIPKPLDLRLIEWVAGAVAEAAVKTGAARKNVNMATYRDELRNRLEKSRARMENIVASYGW
ncbi:MAG: malate dehydrogenase, partial [Desulfovibrio sp.]|nr:malate dehydrogenase [Desulfovibrio sp.]